MKNSLILLILSLLISIPMSLQGQRWSPEEQEFLDHMKSILQQIEDNNEATHELWENTVNPSEDLTWWFTNQGMPYDLESVKKWHQNWETIQGEYTFLNIRPIEIKIIDNVAMIWFYNYGEWITKAGKREPFEDQRLEIFHKKNGEWSFIGGMVNSVDPFDN